MIAKILLKIWPALIPITIYLLWVFIIGKFFKKISERKKLIECKKIIGEKSTSSSMKIGYFSLKNRNFILVLYFSLISVILSLILFAIEL